MFKHRTIISRGAHIAIASGLLVAHLSMAITIAIQYSPTPDELAHVAGGIAIYEFRRFDLYCVNPPLTRLLSGLPAYLMGPTRGWTTFSSDVKSRPEFVAARHLVASHPDRWHDFLICGRLILIPFCLTGGVVCYIWAKRLYGPNAGLIALALWCFSPTIVTWSSLIGSDGLAAASSVGAAFAFRCWLQRGSWSLAGMAGLTLGLALLSKFTLLLLLPLWIILGSIIPAFSTSSSRFSWSIWLAQLSTILATAVYLVNIGYAFTGSFIPLRNYTFHSHLLATAEPVQGVTSPSNRFSESPIGGICVPFPKDFVIGVDIQRKDFEEGKRSYLAGIWQEHGWWHYYLIGILVKIPLGMLVIASITVAAQLSSCCKWINAGNSTFSGEYASEHSSTLRIDHLLLLITPLALFIFVSSQFGFSIHFRYLLPAFPFTYVWSSQIASWISLRNYGRSVVFIALLGWSVVSSVSVFPHSMSYFNEIAGGPRLGHQILMGSGFAWGQNIGYLREWIDENHLDSIPFVSVSSTVPLELQGIRSRGSSPPHYDGMPVGELHGPVPGLHFVDIEAVFDPKSGLAYFSKFQPIDVIAHTIAVYRLEMRDITSVRKDMGLQVFPAPASHSPDFLRRLDSDRRRPKSPRIAFFSLASNGEPCREVPVDIATCFPEAEWCPISASEISSGELARYDLLFIPGGRASAYASSLGKHGRQAIMDYVYSGGGYVGVCAGAFLATSSSDWSLNLINIEFLSGMHYVPLYGEQPWVDRGGGTVKIRKTDPGEEAFSEFGSEMNVDFTGGPVFRPGRHTFLGEYCVLAEYVTEVTKYPFQKGTMTGTPAVVAAPYGHGKVFLVGAHIETTPHLRNVMQAFIQAAAR